MTLRNAFTAATLATAALFSFTPSALADKECGSGYYCIELGYGHEVRVWFVPLGYVTGQDTNDKVVWLDRSSNGGKTWEQMRSAVGWTEGYKREHYTWRACIKTDQFHCTGWH